MAPKWDIDPNEDPYHADGPAPPDKYNFTPSPDLNGSEVGKTLLPKLQNLEPTRLAGQHTRPVPLEHILTFDEGYNALKDVIDDIAQNHHQTWAAIADKINAAATKLSELAGPQSTYRTKITGDTANAMFQKVSDAVPYLQSLAQAASRMDPLVDSFSRDLRETRDWFRTMESKRQENVNNVKRILATQYPSSGMSLEGDKQLTTLALGLVNEQYNNDAKQTIRDFYNPPIAYVSHNHPDMTAEPPKVGPAPGPGGTPQTFSPSGSGRPQSPGGPSTPTMSAMPEWKAAEKTPQSTVPQSTTPTDGAKNAGDAAKGLTDAATDAGKQAQSALGQAGDAAKQAMDQALQAAQKNAAGPLPEGVLGLGPSHGSSAAKAGSGGPRGGGTGGLGGRDAALSKPISQQLSSTKTPSTATPAARAGVSTGTSAPGAGAPAAGHRGGDGGDKIHKVSKALRSTKNGEEVMDEAAAIVPVVGEEQPEQAPTKPS